MFGRNKSPSSFYQTSLGRGILITSILLGGLLVYRIATIPVHVKSVFEHRDIGFNRLLSALYPLDPNGTQAFASMMMLLDTQVDKTTSEGLLNTVLLPFQEQTGPLINLLNRYFPEHAALFHDGSFLSDDLQSLLGMETPQTYLLVLQNTAEKRPNGGFFGSFALVTISRGKVVNLTVSDSYHPAYNRPTTKILGPERLEQFLPERDIYFIGANKVGFTYHDGPHIKTLYEKSYPGNTIRGVVFLRTDMFAGLLPGFGEQLRRRQYINATVDIIRGESRRGKKEVYLTSLQDYLSENRESLMKEFWMQLPKILKNQQINIYLDQVSGKMHTLLREYGLTTRFEENHAYFRDSNIVFNKLDTFIKKQIRLIDSDGNELGIRSGDIVQLPELPAGNLYSFVISYTLDVPERYHEFIRKLNESYGIVLGQREEHILGVHHNRATRGNVYFSPSFKVERIQGDISSQRTFATPFSHNAAYETYIGTNKQTNSIQIQFLVQE